MHPEDVRPFFPSPNSVGVGFKVFGKLSAGNDKGFGVDATAQNVHGCFKVGAVWRRQLRSPNRLKKGLKVFSPLEKGVRGDLLLIHPATYQKRFRRECLGLAVGGFLHGIRHHCGDDIGRRCAVAYWVEDG